MSAPLDSTPAPDTKHPAASVTVWVNALTVAAALLSAAAGLTDNIPQAWMPYILAAYGIVNIILRTITTMPLALGAPNVTRLVLIGAAATTIGVGVGLPHKKASGADGVKVAIILDGSKVASYVVTVDPSKPTIVIPIDAVWFPPSPGPQPTPNPNPNPPPGPSPSPAPLNQTAAAIQQLALQVTGDPNATETAQGLAVIYATIAKSVRDGQITDQDMALQALRMATNTYLATRSLTKPDCWQPMRNKAGMYWTQLQARMAPISAYAQLIEDVAAGLSASSAKTAIDPKTIQMIIDLVLKILQMFIHPTPVPGP